MGKKNDVLDCLRTENKYRGLNLYGILTFDEEGDPYAIQFSISGESINQDLSTLANIDALARMTTLALRNNELDYVITGLLNCSRLSTDLPAIIADILINHAGPNIFKPGEDKDHVQETIIDVDGVRKCQGEECQGRTAQEVCGR